MQHLTHSIKSFEKVATEQEFKGLEKYGQPLNPLDDYDWLKMAQEELADAYKYFVAEKVKRDYYIAKIRKLSNDQVVNYWLDKLEGKNRRSADDSETGQG